MLGHSLSKILALVHVICLRVACHLSPSLREKQHSANPSKLYKTSNRGRAGWAGATQRGGMAHQQRRERESVGWGNGKKVDLDPVGDHAYQIRLHINQPSSSGATKQGGSSEAPILDDPAPARTSSWENVAPQLTDDGTPVFLETHLPTRRAPPSPPRPSPNWKKLPGPRGLVVESVPVTLQTKESPSHHQGSAIEAAPPGSAVVASYVGEDRWARKHSADLAGREKVVPVRHDFSVAVSPKAEQRDKGRAAPAAIFTKRQPLSAAPLAPSRWRPQLQFNPAAASNPRAPKLELSVADAAGAPQPAAPSLPDPAGDPGAQRERAGAWTGGALRASPAKPEQRARAAARNRPQSARRAPPAADARARPASALAGTRPGTAASVAGAERPAVRPASALAGARPASALARRAALLGASVAEEGAAAAALETLQSGACEDTLQSGACEDTLQSGTCEDTPGPGRVPSTGAAGARVARAGPGLARLPSARQAGRGLVGRYTADAVRAVAPAAAELPGATRRSLAARRLTTGLIDARALAAGGGAPQQGALARAMHARELAATRMPESALAPEATASVSAEMHARLDAMLQWAAKEQDGAAAAENLHDWFGKWMAAYEGEWLDRSISNQIKSQEWLHKSGFAQASNRLPPAAPATAPRPAASTRRAATLPADR